MVLVVNEVYEKKFGELKCNLYFFHVNECQTHVMFHKKIFIEQRFLNEYSKLNSKLSNDRINLT